MTSLAEGPGAIDCPTGQLDAFVSGLHYDSMPATAREQAVDILIDSIASALTGRYGDETTQVAGAARALGGRGESTVIAGEPLSLVGAVLHNGWQRT